MTAREGTACHSAHCALHCPRRQHAFRASDSASRCCHRKQRTNGPTKTCTGRYATLDLSRQAPTHATGRCKAYAAAQFNESTSLDEGIETELDEGQSQEGDRSAAADLEELRRLTRMMPDPAEDELFDDRDPTDFSGSNEEQLLQQHGLSSQLLLGNDSFASNYPNDLSQDFGGLEEYDWDDYESGYRQNTDMIAVDVDALDYHLDARRRWEKEKAQDRAFDLFHAQGTSEVNIYAQTHALAHIMTEIDVQDKLESRTSVPLPNWMRAHFSLADCWDGFAEQVKQNEIGEAVLPEKAQGNEALSGAGQASLSIEEQARAMLDEGDYTPQPLMAAFESRQASPTPAVQSDDNEFDQFLTVLPGAEQEAFTQRMMGPSNMYLDEEDLEES